MDKKWTNNDVLYAYTNRWRYVLLLLVLNHPPDIMAAISQTIYSWIFCEWKVYSYESNWQWSSIGLDNGLAPNRRQAIIRTNADPIHWRIYVALGGRGWWFKRGPHFANIYVMTSSLCGQIWLR